MQGLADGYFVIPYTIGGYIASTSGEKINTDHHSFKEAEVETNEKIKKLLSTNGKRTADDFHRELGNIMWEYCGMSRNDEGMKKAKDLVGSLKEEFSENLLVPGSGKEFNQSLEKAGRVSDFLEFAELMLLDGLERRESCGGHFNEAFQTGENEADRDDENFTHVSAWEYTGPEKEPAFHKESLTFENVELSKRSYK
jgi:succinate dehydrogenase flavoprotein subunit